MTFLPWSNDYSVHIRSVDNDHKELFDCVNQLYRAVERGAAAEEVSFAISLLARYVKEHFVREEQLMAEYGYPWLTQHKAQHQHLTHMVHAIRKIHLEAPSDLDAQKLLDFLRDWLTRHILGSDMKYARYLHGNEAKRSTEANSSAKNGHADPDHATQRMERLRIEVPADKADVIRHLARVLQQGGEDAEALIGFADSVGGMSYEEACAVAAPLLR